MLVLSIALIAVAAIFSVTAIIITHDLTRLAQIYINKPAKPAIIFPSEIKLVQTGEKKDNTHNQKIVEEYFKGVEEKEKQTANAMTKEYTDINQVAQDVMNLYLEGGLEDDSR